MTETKKILCENCGKEVRNSWDLDRWGECNACKGEGGKRNRRKGSKNNTNKTQTKHQTQNNNKLVLVNT